MMYVIVFKDTAHGTSIESFETWDEALEYWESYADTETCMAGLLLDTEEQEIIWQFREETLDKPN